MENKENINRNLPPQNFYEPETDTRTSEEKFIDLVERFRPYFLRLWQARWKLIIFNSIVLLLTILYLLFLAKPYYESTVTILPEYGSKSSTLSGLSELASMAGVKVGEGAPTEIYQNLIFSESVLEPVVYAKYKTEEFEESVNLIEYFEIEPKESLPKNLQERQMFLEVFKDLTKSRIKTDVERLTKILTITVTMPESKLSADVSNKIVESLDNYIRTKRKSYATEQRFYIEKRIAQVRDSLTIAEEKLKSFREQNRVVAQSPQLLMEQGRLMRNVEIQQAVYVELNKQLEIARIDEIRDTPVLNVKEKAAEPILKAGPKRMNTLIIILFLSVLFSAWFFAFQNSIKKYTGYLGIDPNKI